MKAVRILMLLGWPSLASLLIYQNREAIQATETVLGRIVLLAQAWLVWPWWLQALSVFAALAYCLIVLILLPSYRQYKLVNGDLHVKEGFGGWEPLDEHLKREHPKAYRKMKDSEERK